MNQQDFNFTNDFPVKVWQFICTCCEKKSPRYRKKLANGQRANCRYCGTEQILDYRQISWKEALVNLDNGRLL